MWSVETRQELKKFLGHRCVVSGCCIIAGQTAGLKVGCGMGGGFMADSWGIHGGFMGDSWRIHGGFMANGFAKVDNGFGYEKWLQGGVIGFD
jgi:hypothetical protein